MVQWKDIEGYEGLYQVSTDGNVKSLRKHNHKNPIILKPKLTWDGYYDITLYYDGKPKSIRVHRIVAETFIPNKENKPQVNHIDGNKLNNCVTNLEWVTNIENHVHAIRIGLEKVFGDENPNSKAVIQMDKNGNYIREYSCIKYASDLTGVSQNHISSVCTGKRKSAGGFIWAHKGGGENGNRCNCQ